jgi:hypothetical protein
MNRKEILNSPGFPQFLRRTRGSAQLQKRWYLKLKFGYTVKLGYNELGYNELSVIANKKIYLVGLGHFNDNFSRL